MRMIRKTALMAAAVTATSMFSLSAQSQVTYNWLGTEGTFNWDFPENWSQPDPNNPSYPNAAGNR